MALSLGSETDDKGQCTCHNVDTNFPVVGTLGAFLTTIWLLAVSCVNKQTGTPMTTPYFKHVKKLLAEYLMNYSPYLVEWIYGKDKVQDLFHG